jgi:uncharacterized protein YhhL (DUF1145 family)
MNDIAQFSIILFEMDFIWIFVPLNPIQPFQKQVKLYMQLMREH